LGDADEGEGRNGPSALRDGERPSCRCGACIRQENTEDTPPRDSTSQAAGRGYRMTGVRVRDLHERWAQDPEYRAAYDAMEDEFASAADQIRRSSRASSSQAAPARRVSASETAERIEYYRWSSPPPVKHMTQEKERVLARLV